MLGADRQIRGSGALRWDLTIPGKHKLGRYLHRAVLACIDLMRLLTEWQEDDTVFSVLGSMANRLDRISVVEVGMERDKKILIVDDEAFIRILLKQTLEDLEDDGVELLVAADGEEGLEMALSQRPCLVFLDVMMPKLNGYEVCRRLKEADSSIYVILLTAKGQAIDRETGFSVGANEYVTKPFDPDYILEKTTEILEINSLT